MAANIMKRCTVTRTVLGSFDKGSIVIDQFGWLSCKLCPLPKSTTMTQIKSHTTIVSPGVFTKTKHHRVARVVDLEVSSSFVPQLQGTRINMVKSLITSVSREVSKLKHHLLGACISLVVILYQYMKSHHSFVILREKG